MLRLLGSLATTIAFVSGCTQTATDNDAANGAATTSDEASADLTPPDDPEASLAELGQQVHDAFAEYDEVEELIYPKGWVHRKVIPGPQETELLAKKIDGAVAGIVRLKVERVGSVIRPTKEKAAADEELYPFVPAPSREEMVENPLNAKLEPVILTLTYAYRDGAWQRVRWEFEPHISRSADWFDRIGVP